VSAVAALVLNFQVENKGFVAEIPQQTPSPLSSILSNLAEREIVTIHFKGGGFYTGTVKGGGFGQDGKPHGYGTATLVGRGLDTYKGEFRDGVYHGRGTLSYGFNKIIERFEGEFKNGKQVRGTTVFKNGVKYTDSQDDEKYFAGIGTWQLTDGQTISGSYEDARKYLADLETENNPKGEEKHTVKKGWYLAVRSTRTFRTPDLGAASHDWLDKGTKVRVVDSDGEFVSILSVDGQPIGYVRQYDVEFDAEFSG